MKHYARICRAVSATPWALMPEKLEAMLCFLAMKAEGGITDTSILADLHQRSAEAAARQKSAAMAGGGSVAVLPLFGLISQRSQMLDDISAPSGTSTTAYTQQFRQAMADPNVKAIVLDIDSPGGSISGVDELASEIYSARGKKPITAVSDCLCASAAYYIGSQASDFVVSPSSLTGSIGVYAAHEDDSRLLEGAGVKVTLISAGKYKVDGNAYEPLSDTARNNMQEMVNDFYSMFTRAVARGRGVKVDDVRNGFGQGRVLTAQDAVKSGMADRVGTLDDVLSSYGVGGSAPSRVAAGDLLPGIAAEEAEAEVLGAEEQLNVAARSDALARQAQRMRLAFV